MLRWVWSRKGKIISLGWYCLKRCWKSSLHSRGEGDHEVQGRWQTQKEKLNVWETSDWHSTLVSEQNSCAEQRKTACGGNREAPVWCGHRFLAVEEKKKLGHLCKLLIDQGRVAYLQQRGFRPALQYYTDPAVSLENVLLTALPTPSAAQATA